MPDLSTMQVAMPTLYTLILVFTLLHIFAYVTDPTKALAYALLVIVFPVFGMILYYSIGVNYRRNKLYFQNFKSVMENQPEVVKKFQERADDAIELYKDQIGYFMPLVNIASNENQSTINNKTKLLVNGENKFPDVLDALRNAKDHIHIEYYIYEQDDIGYAVADILKEKVQEGLEVRFIYDAFGSRKLKKSFVDDLRDAGVEVIHFFPLKFFKLANRLNYRNHRKIIVIDGHIGYLGGINVSHRYINNGENDLFWRDTHIRIDGMAVNNLQYIFMRDWNFATNEKVPFSTRYFPVDQQDTLYGDEFTQIVASGPDSDYPNIMYSLIKAMECCREELLITTPYFIPDKSFINAVKIASLSDVKVKLLIPGVSDSALVNGASHTYYQELMDVGIEVYEYQKGFVHAKTMVCDRQVAIVGTANLDHRSFELNFEVNSIVYNRGRAEELAEVFYNDLKDATKIDPEEWRNRPQLVQITENMARLTSALL